MTVVVIGTALVNHLRALLLERGLAVAKGRAKLRKEVAELVSGVSAELSPRIRILVEDRVDEWERLDERSKAFDAEFVAIARADPGMRRLSTVPGIRPINATALVAAVGDAHAFGKGRDLAAWLGLVLRAMVVAKSSDLRRPHGRSRRSRFVFSVFRRPPLGIPCPPASITLPPLSQRLRLKQPLFPLSRSGHGLPSGSRRGWRD